MKYLKILLTAAAAGAMLTSCYERQFTPTLGDTPVEFVYSTIDTTLSNSTIYLPVHLTEQSSTGGKATLVFTGGTIVMRDGSSREAVEFTNDETGYANGGDVMITSYELYIGAYDEEEDGTDGLPTNSFEVKLPDYLEYESISLNFELQADNLGNNTTLTYNAVAPTEAVITGSWSINGNTYSISEDGMGGYLIQTPYVEGQFAASRVNNTLTITTAGVAAEDPDLGTISVIMCAYHAADDGKTYLWPDEACIWDFSEDGTTVTLTNGTFIGFANPTQAGSYYNWNGSAMEAGTTGTKQ